jgi:hypothetical protein
MGAIGMTYEQGGSGRAGLGIINNVKNELTLFDRLLHHTITGISTIETASRNASKLNDEFQKYFDNTDLNYKSFVLRGAPEKIKKVVDLLKTHEIMMEQAVEKSVKVYDYESKSLRTIKTTSNDWVVHTDQPKGKMVKVLFEPETKLSDSASYDITAWSISHAHGLRGFASTSKIESKIASQVPDKKTDMIGNDKSTYAFIIPWKDVSDGELLGALLEDGFYARYAPKSFTVEGKTYPPGSIIVMRSDNHKILDFNMRILEIARRLTKQIIPVFTGFVDSGYDFGSNNVRLIKTKRIAVLSGTGASPYSFGTIWHFFETQLNYPLHVLDSKSLSSIDLAKYQVLLIPSGYSAGKSDLEKLTSYLSKGGKLIVIGSAMNSFADKDGFKLKKKEDKKEEDAKSADISPYDMRNRMRLTKAVNGSIFKSSVDNTHPMAFGYDKSYYSLKNSGTAYELLKDGINVAYYPENTKVVSGFAGIDAQKFVPNSLLFGVEQKGRGKLIYMVDDPLYRSFWENGKLFFVNALFFD